jgi:hypothetical protein
LSRSKQHGKEHLEVNNNMVRSSHKQQYGKELPFLQQQQKKSQGQEHKCAKQKTNAQNKTLTCAMLIKLPPYMNDKP